MTRLQLTAFYEFLLDLRVIDAFDHVSYDYRSLRSEIASRVIDYIAFEHSNDTLNYHFAAILLSYLPVDLVIENADGIPEVLVHEVFSQPLKTFRGYDQVPVIERAAEMDERDFDIYLQYGLAAGDE